MTALVVLPGLDGTATLHTAFGVEGAVNVLYAKEVSDNTSDLHSVGVGVVAKNFGGHQGFFMPCWYRPLTVELLDDDFDVIEDGSSTEPYVGAMVGYDINDHFGLSLNFDYLQADIEGLDIEAKKISVGGEYRF